MRGLRYLIYKIKGRKRVNVDLSRVGFILYCSFLGIGIVLLSLAIYFSISDYKEEQLADKTEATISSISYDKKDYKAVVKYVVDGNSYEGEIKVSKSDAVSDKKIIKYNKDDPSKIIDNNHILFIFIGGAIGLVMIIRSFIYIIPYLLNILMIKNIRKKGYYIDAYLDEVYINSKARKILGFYPYRIKLKYVNPADGNILVFDSQDSYADLKQIVEDYNVTTLPVFVDNKNPNKYYVDLDIILPKRRG